jgi:TP901 family phage tail tape measure protein
LAGNIKGITIEIDGNVAPLNKALESVNKSAREIQSELKQVEKLMKLDPKNTELVAQKQKLLADAVKNTEDKLKTLKEAERQLNDQFKRGELTQEQYEEQHRALQREIIATEQKLYSLEKSLGSSNDKWRDAGLKLEAIGDKMQKVGDKMSAVGQKMTLGVTAPIMALGGLAAKAAIDFESAFAGVIKTVDATDEELAVLRQGIRDMAKEIPASAAAIAEVSEAAGQLGIENENILSFTRTMIDLGEATNLSASEAASSLAQFANITQMSQKDFDRLGSTIVALGNNMATTEADIVSMAMRLAGAGSQIGLSEAQIVSFAAALSSVGIEAQAGGSAFSKVMMDMQLAVETGSEKLTQFASVAGMSASEFQKAFKDDATTAIIAFIQGLSTAEERGMSAIKVLDDMGITEVRLRDALLRAAGASDIFTSAVATGNEAWAKNEALSKEASQRYETTASKLAILKNKVVDLGISFGELILPNLIKLTDKIGEFIDWLNKLSPAARETILKLAGIAAAIGPILLVGGKLVSTVGLLTKGLGSILPKIATLIPGLSGIGAAAAGAGGGMAGLGVSFAALANPVGIAVAAIAGAVVGIIALKNYLEQDAIPQVELFGEGVSESTAEALGSFMELESQASVSLNLLSATGQEVTSEMKNSIVGNFTEMKNQVVAVMQEQKEESIAALQELFINSTTLSEAEKAENIRLANEMFDDKIKAAEDGNARIQEILEKAAAENRTTTAAENAEMLAIQQQFYDNALLYMTENEQEQLAIKASLAANKTAISLDEAQKTIAASAQARDASIADAEAMYKDRLVYAEMLRAEGGQKNIELADTIVNEAQRARDESIDLARQRHDEVVKLAESQAANVGLFVNKESGETLSRAESTNALLAESYAVRYSANSAMWEGIYSKTQEKAGAVKQKISEMASSAASKIGEFKNNAVQKFTDLKTAVSQKASEIVQSITSFFSSLPGKMLSWGKDMISKFISGLKSLKIPLPHFSLTGSFSLDPPSVPKLSVKWYDKGAIFYGPQVIGVGEKRPEFVGALDDLKAIVKMAMGETLNSITNNTTYGGVTLTGNNFIVRNDEDINRIAKAVSRELYREQVKASRGRGILV